MIDVAAYIALSIAQALAAAGQSPPGGLPSTVAAATVDDVGGPPTAPPLATRVREWSPADVLVPALLLLGSFAAGRATGLVTARKPARAAGEGEG